MTSFAQKRTLRAFTLAEVTVSAGVVLVLGLIVVAMMQSSLTLYVQNFSVNDANLKGRSVTQRLGEKIQNAVQAPTLIDATGAAVAGNGPAAGIQCVVPASQAFYKFLSDRAVTGTTITTTVNSTDRKAPNPGDFVFVQWYDSATGGSGTAFVDISSVTTVGTTATITLSKTLMAALSPTPVSSAVIKTGQPFQVMNRVAFIAVASGGTTKLRYYPRARSVAVDGATAFNNPANYRELTDLKPLPAQATCSPFSYTVSDQRYIDLDIRVLSSRYDKRSGSSENYFNSLRSKIAFRSIIKTS